MFTEGLDQNAIQWIKQGADTGRESRSPLTENLHRDDIPGPFPVRSTSSYLSSPTALPPLKFHSGLLVPHSVATLSLYDNSDSNYEDDDDDDDEEESVASAPNEMGGDCSEISFDQHSTFDALDDLPWHAKHEEVHGFQESAVIPDVQSGCMINRGLSKANLKVEVPSRVNALHDVGSLSGHSQRYMTPQSVQVTPVHQTRFYDAVDLGTPSAPPVIGSEKEINIGIDDNSEERTDSDFMMDEETGETDHAHIFKYTSKSRQNNDFEGENQTAHPNTETEAPHCRTNSFAPSLCYNTSSRQAWQVLVAYDACIRLCLHAWAGGCPDAPEFLRDECLILRSAFGLNNFLLQPHGMKPTEGSETTKSSTTQLCSTKPTKVVGKMRVEVKKLRIIRRRKLRGTFSQRGGLYMQVGAEYVRQVSSYVKTGINSVMNSSSLMTYEDPMSCLLHLKSCTGDSSVESVSAVCLRPGTGDYNDFFPESQRDALVIEVQDSKHVVHGQAVISILSLADASNDKLRWWPLFHGEHECIGKVQLFAASTFTSEEEKHVKSGPVVETLAYDLLLEAAMRAEQFQSQSLQLGGPWKWLLTEFAQYYGVSDSYTKLRYLSHVMDVATPTKDCLELVQDLLETVLKARIERKLNRREKSILLDCEMQVESLLANVFENYKSLDELSPTGLTDSLTPIPESAPPAFAAAVQVYTLLHDILTQDEQKILQCYLQTAAKKRCRKHMMETDDFLSSNYDNILGDPMVISTAYLKMKNLCSNLSSEIHADIKIHNQHLLPTSIDLSNITASVYSTELSRRLKGFLAACPPSSPLPHVNALLQATDDFQRDLESWDISPIQGGVNSKSLFDDYIMVWVQDMQIGLLELCKAEKVPWSGVVTNHSTSPFVENMYLKIKDGLDQYEVVISRWPQYSLVLENAVADVESAIIKSLQRQYSEILTPLKDSIPKKLGLHVQKLARRQSMTLYSVPNQLGTFLNSLKRILDVLHCSIEQILKSWASLCPPIVGGQKSFFGEQMNDIKILLRTKYKNYMQAIVAKLYTNMQASRGTQLKKILEDTQDSDGESEIRERMQMMNAQLNDSISNLHEVFTSQIFIALCRGFWDRMGQSVLKFLEGRKENRVWYKGSYYALGILDDTFASQMQRLQGNALLEKDLEPPQSVVEARSILCRDASNGTPQSSNYFYY